MARPRLASTAWRCSTDAIVSTSSPNPWARGSSGRGQGRTLSRARRPAVWSAPSRSEGFRLEDDNFNFSRTYEIWFADIAERGLNLIVTAESDLAFGRALIRLTRVRDFEGRVLLR